MATKNYFLFKVFCLLLFEARFTSFLKDKKSQNSKNQDFSYYFCLMIEGSGSEPHPYLVLMDPAPDPGGPKTYLFSSKKRICLAWRFDGCCCACWHCAWTAPTWWATCAAGWARSAPYSSQLTSWPGFSSELEARPTDTAVIDAVRIQIKKPDKLLYRLPAEITHFRFHIQEANIQPEHLPPLVARLGPSE